METIMVEERKGGCVCDLRQEIESLEFCNCGRPKGWLTAEESMADSFHEFHRGYIGGTRNAAKTILAALREMPFGFLAIEQIERVCREELDIDDLEEVT